jgi:hypothetical protein
MRVYGCVVEDKEICKALGLKYLGETPVGKDCLDYEEGICKCEGVCMFKFPIKR